MSTTVTIDLELVSGAFKKALSDSSKQVKEFGAVTQDSFKKSTGAWDVFAGTLATTGVSKALSIVQDMASQLFQTFIVDGVKAAAEQEESINKLNNALALSGSYSLEASNDLQKFASQLQATTKFSDDSVLSASALITSLSNLSGEGLKKATESAADLSTVLGIDLQSAAQLVGKAMSGEVGSLSRYGIKVKEGATAAETASNALDALQKKFGGSAQGAVNTFSGAIILMNNAFGEVQETIGNIIVQNPVLVGLFKDLSQVLTELSVPTSENTNLFKEMVGQGIILVIDSIQALITITEAFWKIGSLAFNGLKVSILSFAIAASQALSLVGLSSDETTNKLQQSWNEAAASINDSLANKSGLAQFNDRLSDVRRNAETALESMKTNSDVAASSVKNNQDAMITSSQETDQKLLELREQKAISDEEWRLAQEAQSLQLRDAKFAQLVTDLGLEQAIRRQAEMNILTDKTNANKLILQTDIDTNKKRLDDYKKLNEAKKAEDEKTLTNFASITSSLGQIASLGGKKYFQITKALNLASAISSGIAAVQAAMAAPPGPPFNSFSVAATGIAAAANVARAASVQAPNFAQGGIVPGSSYVGDKVRANVNSGEMILNKQQQSNLFEIARNGNSSSSSTDYLLVELIRTVRGAQVIQIDGKEIINVVRDGLSSGRSFS